MNINWCVCNKVKDAPKEGYKIEEFKTLLYQI